MADPKYKVRKYSEAVVPEKAKAKPEPTLEECETQLGLCRSHDGTFQQWGTQARAKLQRRFERHGVTIEWDN